MRFNKLNSLLFIVFAFYSVSNINAQKKEASSVSITKASDISNPLNSSLTYTLPKTALRIEVKTEQVIKKAGPYFRYSQRFLNLSNVITEDQEEWSITGIKVSTMGVPDTDQRYTISTTGNNPANLISLTPDGILKGINLHEQNISPEDTAYKIQENMKAEDVNFDNIAYNQDLLLKTSTAAMAQEAANMIYQIRSYRNNLLSGEAENLPPDGEAYKLVLKELDKQEKDFMSLFIGKTVSIKHTKIFEITPDPLSSYNNYVLCRFSNQKGILDQMDITGTPVYLNIEDNKNVVLSNSTAEDPKNVQNKGFYYYLPGEITVSLKDKTTEIFKGKISVAQYGKTAYLPSQLFNNENISIEFDSNTGAILHISR